MPIAEIAEATIAKADKKTAPLCFHCGASCLSANIHIDEKHFCCEGCQLVYEIINSNDLCNYYELGQHPGLNSIKASNKEKYAFLDDTAIASKLYTFTDGDYTIVTFYIPGVHCSSCMWLLEHLRRFHEGITESRLNFSTKELTIQFSQKKVTLREITSLLASIGYEPYLSLDDEDGRKAAKPNRQRIYRLGVAGFCFSFIMMMSFPEYFGGAAMERSYATIFRTLNLLLALPVFFFCAGEFFATAWQGLKAKTLNIDAPIALAILITFSRSLYEILSGTGAGYLDSMSGIVFFMLIGRAVQERTYQSLSFHRDYKSYFPIAVTIITESGPQPCSLHDLKPGDIVQLNNDELIPADCTILNDKARIDYSFVTGESEPVRIERGQPAYAGGRQIGEQIILQIQKPVAGSYLTSLWNHHAFTQNNAIQGKDGSRIHQLSRYFTTILVGLAIVTGLYWAFNDPSRILNSITAMLIVACPCALLLSSTFTNGNLLRVFSNTGLFLRDASVIEQLGKIDYIAFDKTGTLTQGTTVKVWGDEPLGLHALEILRSISEPSNHPYSKALQSFSANAKTINLSAWRELPGLGVEAMVEGIPVKLGSAVFTGAEKSGANVHLLIGSTYYGFVVAPRLRNNLATMIHRLQSRFQLSLLSGDHAGQQMLMRSIFGKHSTLLFEQKPLDKLAFVARMQQLKHKVLMIGDGLNDAGALQQSDTGITLADDVNNFTPACDAIMEASQFTKLPDWLSLARAGRNIINASFGVSLLYNIGGLFFAMQGKLNPMIAAILMPASTLTIILLSTSATTLTAWYLRLTR